MRPTLAACLILAPGLAACDSGTEGRPQATASRSLERPAAPAPPGSVPRGAVASAALAAPGPAATSELVRRGQERFLVFCSPCHGARGRGDGAVVSRGFPPPPSFDAERLRAASREHIVAVISNGIGDMFPYGDRVPPEDRWAIASYVKSLQDGPATSPSPAPAATSGPSRP